MYLNQEKISDLDIFESDDISLISSVRRFPGKLGGVTMTLPITETPSPLRRLYVPVCGKVPRGFLTVKKPNGKTAYSNIGCDGKIIPYRIN